MAKNRRTIKALVVCICVAGALFAAALWCLKAQTTVVLHPEVYNGPLNNPMAGFAPCADYNDIVGDSQLVYVDVTWRELEPERGKFDFMVIDESNNLNEWRVKGKHVVFRFLCDVPGNEAHMDIPDWLYEATNHAGSWYDTNYGKGFSPDYANPLLIRSHREAIQALGLHYGKDDFFCYIELGSLGHWGEWHTRHDSGIAPLPLESVRDQYIQPYLESFPHAIFLMRRPFRAAANNNMGLYNDMTGDPESTQEWLQWIENGGPYNETGEPAALMPMPDAWKKSAIGGEFTDELPMKTLLEDQLDQTLRLIRESHSTFIGPNCPLLPEDRAYDKGVQSVLASLGSRLRISRAELRQPKFFPGDLTVSLTWVNDGCAPFYWSWEVVLCVLDRKGGEVLRQPIDGLDIRKVIDDKGVLTTTVLPFRDLPAGTYSLAVAILDPDTGYPAYNLAMSGARPDHLCVFGEWKQE